MAGWLNGTLDFPVAHRAEPLETGAADPDLAVELHDSQESMPPVAAFLFHAIYGSVTLAMSTYAGTTKIAMIVVPLFASKFPFGPLESGALQTRDFADIESR